MLRVRMVSSTSNAELARPRAASASVARWAALVALVEFAAISISAYLASFAYYAIVLDNVAPPDQYIPAAILIASFYVVICMIDDQYNFLGEKWARRGISRGIGAVALAFVLFLSFTFLWKVTDGYSRGTLISQLALVSPVLIATRTLLGQWLEGAAKSGRFQGHGVVVVSLAHLGRADDFAQKLCKAPDKIVRWYDIDIEQTGSTSKARDEVVAQRLAAIKNECRKLRADTILVIFDAESLGRVIELVEVFYELPVKIQLLPHGMVLFMQQSRIAQSGLVRVLELSAQPLSMLDRFLKRALDLLGAVFLLVLLSPLLLLVAIAIKLDSRGPALFRQLRHGFNNEPIRIFKFRTMSTMEDGDTFRQATKSDSRVTRLGRLLRRTNLDELPQLLNVIQGNMSLVGPRPHPVALNDAYVHQIKLLARRHNMKPGITGWAQVNGYRGETDTCEKMRARIEYDLYYLDNWSLFFDIKILFMTLLSRSAYSNAY